MKKKIIFIISIFIICICGFFIYTNRNLASGKDGISLLCSEYGNHQITKLSDNLQTEENIIEGSTYELEEAAIKEKVNEIKVATEDTANAMNIRYDQLIINNWGYENTESYEEEIQEKVTTFIKLRLAVYQYAQDNHIKITNKEYEKLLPDYAEKFGYDDVKKFKEECDGHTIACEILYDKTLNIMLNK